MINSVGEAQQLEEKGISFSRFDIDQTFQARSFLSDPAGTMLELSLTSITSAMIYLD